MKNEKEKGGKTTKKGLICMFNFKQLIDEEQIKKAEKFGYKVTVDTADVVTFEKKDKVIIVYPNGAMKHYCPYYDVSADLTIYSLEVYLYGKKREDWS